jgi:hypothetical protein
MPDSHRHRTEKVSIELLRLDFKKNFARFLIAVSVEQTRVSRWFFITSLNGFSLVFRFFS